MAIATAGDNVVMPTPWYFNHQMWLSMLGVGINPIPAFNPGANYPDVEAARAAINDKTRAIVLCTPNNPSGAIYPADVIGKFFELAQEKSLALILDETYRDFRPEATPPHDLFKRPDWQKTLIQLYSFSKIYALAGYRLGSMIASPELLHEVAKIIDCMTICAPQITQRAVLFGLNALEPWKNEKKSLMAGRLAAMREALKTPGLNYQLISSGAYFAYVRHPFSGESSKSVAQRLAKENDLLCLPGSMFGPNQEDYLRLAFANVDASLMPELAARLIESQK
jgi:aspartate/methionine/tyrosine aminotransferase